MLYQAMGKVWAINIPYTTYIWREFSLAVAWPSPFGGHLYWRYLLGVIAALQYSLLLADTIIGGCKASLPNRQIKVTAKYKLYTVGVVWHWPYQLHFIFILLTLL